MHADEIDVRRLTPREALAGEARLRSIFRDAVLAAGPAHFDAARVDTWASGADDARRWRPRLADGVTWIASDVASGATIGFAVVHPADYVDLLYVDPAFHRRGVATRLLTALEAMASGTGAAALSAHASPIAHPLFVRHGYALQEWQTVEHGGHVFPRAAVRKALR